MFGLLLVTVCVATDVFAQTAVAGIVIDDRTEKPIKGVLVYVEHQSVFAETDDDGRFSLSVPRGQHTITASVIAYALLQTDIDVAAAPIDLTIRLSEGAGAYTERVTVSGSLRTESDSVPGSTSLHGRELENLRGAVLDDPLRALQSLPAATATDDFYSEFAVRGNPFRYVGMVVDGVPTRYLMHSVNGITDGGSIAMINSDTLGSVALLPGSYPQRTGRRLGAQIDLTTREGSRDQFRGRAGLSGTSAFMLGEGPIGGKGSWLASVRRSYLDYLIKRIDPEAGFAFGFVDTQVKAVYDLTPRHQSLDGVTRRQGRVRRRRPGHRHQRDSKGHQPGVADLVVVAISAEPARRRHSARVFNRPAVQQRQPRRGSTRRRTVHRARVAHGRLVRAVSAPGRGIRR